MLLVSHAACLYPTSESCGGSSIACWGFPNSTSGLSLSSRDRHSWPTCRYGNKELVEVLMQGEVWPLQTVGIQSWWIKAAASNPLDTSFECLQLDLLDGPKWGWALEARIEDKHNNFSCIAFPSLFLFLFSFTLAITCHIKYLNPGPYLRLCFQVNSDQDN